MKQRRREWRRRYLPAEALDSLLIRPVLMVWLPRWLEHFGWSIRLAKRLANITFYGPAILSYELRKQ